MASCFFIIYDDTVRDSGWFKGQLQKSIETFVTHRLNVHCSHWSIALWEGNWFSNLTLSEKAKKRIFQDVELFFSFMREQVCVMDVSLRCAAAWCCFFCGETVENSAQKASGPFQTGSFLKAAAAVITNDWTWMVSCPLVCHLNTIHAENQRWLLLPDAPTLENDLWNVAVLLINGWMEAHKVQTSPLRRRWVIKIKCLNGSPVITESGSRSELISSLQVDNESCVNTGSQFVLTHSPTHRRSPVWLWESQHSDPVVPEWFTPSVFRCISLSKHPGARSQAVKLFCALTNKPSSLTARKPSGENDSQLGGLRHECNGSDCAERGRPARLSQPLSFQKGSHYWGHYTQQRRGETTQTVCRHPAELTSHPASKPLISRRFEVWVLIAICGYAGVAARCSLIDRISASACWRRCLCDEIRCKKKRPPTTNKQNIL